MRWQRVVYNDPITAGKVGFIVPGQTQMAEVVHKLGSPTQLDPAIDGAVLRYEFYDGKYFTSNYLWGLRFLLPLLSPDASLGNGGLTFDEFQACVDRQWVVKWVAFTKHGGTSAFRAWPFDYEPPPDYPVVAF